MSAANDDTRTTDHGPAALDIAEVAHLLGCSVSHVRRLALGGGFPQPVAVGTLKRWRRDDVLMWLNGRPAADPRRTVRGGQVIEVRG